VGVILSLGAGIFRARIIAFAAAFSASDSQGLVKDTTFSFVGILFFMLSAMGFVLINDFRLERLLISS